MKKYNHNNCKSLFGYSSEVHIRCKGQCQLCGCGGSPLDFDLWRQMTVEHLIGKSQGGYLKQIRDALGRMFPDFSETEVESLSEEIDVLNTVTACQFCNSTTSRDVSSKNMEELLSECEGNRKSILANIEGACNDILCSKRAKVQWKLKSVKEAFHEKIISRI